MKYVIFTFVSLFLAACGNDCPSGTVNTTNPSCPNYVGTYGTPNQYTCQPGTPNCVNGYTQYPCQPGTPNCVNGYTQYPQGQYPQGQYPNSQYPTQYGYPNGQYQQPYYCQPGTPGCYR